MKKAKIEKGLKTSIWAHIFSKTRNLSSRWRKCLISLKNGLYGQIPIALVEHTFALIAALSILVGCGTVKSIPIETRVEYHIIDSVRIEVRDSVRIFDKSRQKDYGKLTDTLDIQGKRSSMRAWADTTNMVIGGELTEFPSEERIRIVYKDRVEVRDSIVLKEVPIPVEIEKEVRYVPWIYKVLSAIGLLGIGIFAALIAKKIKIPTLF